MKKLTLTVAEFLLLSKVHESETLNNEAAIFVEENANLTDPEVIAGEVTMALSTDTFDDTVCAVDDYKEKMAEDDPERPAVLSLLEKLEAVEEEPVDQTDDYRGADKD